jgi:hypothetical protein
VKSNWEKEYLQTCTRKEKENMLKDGGMEGAGAQGKFGNKDLPDM